MTDEQRLNELNQACKEQWAKLDAAIARGLRGAPLTRIDQKLRRLEDERDALDIRLRYGYGS